MDNRSEGGGVAIAIGLALFVILLLLAGGGGAFYFIQRQRMAMTMEMERAYLAEEMARMEALRARDMADATAAARAEVLAAAQQTYAKAAVGDSIPAAVEAVLRTQEEAWNRGDIEAFMEHYSKTADLTFSSGGKTTRGWTETLNRYKEKYPGPEKMGKLKLSGLEITPLGDSAALVLGQWNVERDSEPLSGNFSLVLRKVEGRWLIVHDHTSRLMAEP